MRQPYGSETPFGRRFLDTYMGLRGIPTLGDDKPGAGQACTVLWFTDGSALCVNWDGGYEVSGTWGNRDHVIISCPRGRRKVIPWHRIEMIDHQDREEDK